MVLALESSAFLIKGTFPFSPIYLLGSVRAADLFILIFWGPWSFRGIFNRTALKKALSVTLLFGGPGLLALIFWKNFLGSSILKWTSELFYQKGLSIVAFYITSCLLSPAAEEFIFRGILYRKLRVTWNAWICICIISLLFALIHLTFNGQALVPFLGSLIFCLGYEKTKSILTPILLHITGNVIIFSSPFFKFI